MLFGRDIVVNVVGSVVGTLIVIWFVKNYWPEGAKVLP